MRTLWSKEESVYRKLKAREMQFVPEDIGRINLENNTEMYVCFIPWDKAFNGVDWKILLKILKYIGLEWKDRKLIKESYRQHRM